jgi:hypothetical protein
MRGRFLPSQTNPTATPQENTQRTDQPAAEKAMMDVTLPKDFYTFLFYFMDVYS